MGARDAYITVGPKRAEPYKGAREGQVPQMHAQGDAVGSVPKNWKTKNTFSNGEWARGTSVAVHVPQHRPSPLSQYTIATLPLLPCATHYS